MFGIGIPELILIAIVALIVVGPKDLPVTLRAIGRAIREFQRASRELRKEAGFDEVVDEVTRPLREGLAGIEADVLRESEDTRYEYPEDAPDTYDALPEGANVYPDLEAEAAEAANAAPAPTATVREQPEGTFARKSAGRWDGAATKTGAEPDANATPVGPDPGVQKAPPGFALRPPDENDPIVAAKLRAAREGAPVNLDAIIAAKLAAAGATSTDDPILAQKWAALAPRPGSETHDGEDPVVAAKVRSQREREAAIAAKIAALTTAPAAAPAEPTATPVEAPATGETTADAVAETAAETHKNVGDPSDVTTAASGGEERA